MALPKRVANAPARQAKAKSAPAQRQQARQTARQARTPKRVEKQARKYDKRVEKRRAVDLPDLDGGGGGFSLNPVDLASRALKGAGEAALGGLNAIDKYVAGPIRSGVQEVTDLQRQAIDLLPEDLQKAAAAVAAPVNPLVTLGEMTGAKAGRGSAKDFLDQISGQMTGGEMLAKQGVKNPVAQTIGGFGLDIGLDPLTYVGVPKALRSPDRVVDRLHTASVAAKRAGETEKAERLAKGGAAVIRDKSVRNVERGVLPEVALPEKGLTIAGRAIPHSEGAYKALSFLPNKIRTAAGDTLGEGRKFINAADAEARAFERGKDVDPFKALEANALRRSETTATHESKGFSHKWRREFGNILKGVPRKNRDRYVQEIAETPAHDLHLTEAGRAFGPERSTALKGHIDNVYKALDEAGVDIQRVRDYFPRWLSDTVKNLPDKTRSFGRLADDIAKHRELVRGKKLHAFDEAGEVIEEVTLEGTSKQIRDQIIDFYQRHHNVDPYRDDATSVWSAYLDQAGRLLANKRSQNSLIERGIVPPATAKRTAEQLLRAKPDINKLGLRLSQAEGAQAQALERAERKATDLAENAYGHSAEVKSQLPLLDPRQQVGDLLGQADEAARLRQAGLPYRGLVASETDALQQADDLLSGAASNVAQAPRAPTAQLGDVLQHPQLGEVKVRGVLDNGDLRVSQRVGAGKRFGKQEQVIGSADVLGKVRERVEEQMERLGGLYDEAAEADEVAAIAHAKLDAVRNGDVKVRMEEGGTPRYEWLRNKQAFHAEGARGSSDPWHRQLHRQFAAYYRGEADAAELGQKVFALDDQIKWMKNPETQQMWRDLGALKMREILLEQPDLALDPDVARVMRRFFEEQGPAVGSSWKWMRGYDRIMNAWKGLAIATPGFLSRNLQGAVITNLFLASENPAKYTSAATDWLHIRWSRNPERTIAKVAKKRGMKPEDLKFIWDEVGLFAHQGQAATEFLQHEGALGRLSPSELLGGRTTRAGRVAKRFNIVHDVGVANQGVEDFARGSLAFHLMLDAEHSADEALDAINKFHFDYDNLSRAERGVAKRIIPFYVFFRRNLPLQWEQAVRRPGVYDKYAQLKNEVERQSVRDKIVPDYFLEGGGFQLPIEQEGGHIWEVPDAPIKDLLNPPSEVGDLLSLVGPLKLPIEAATNRQAFKSLPLGQKLEDAPAAWEAIPGLMPTLGALGLVKKGKMKEEDKYIVQTILPSLGVLRRAFGSEGGYEDRRLSSVISTLVGGGLRTNTKYEQRKIVQGKRYREQQRLYDEAVTPREKAYARAYDSLGTVQYLNSKGLPLKYDWQKVALKDPERFLQQQTNYYLKRQRKNGY